MPQWRKLHTKICESLDFSDMPDDFTRLLWVLLPTQLCREGRGIDNPSWVRARVFPLREDVSLAMVSAAMDWFAQRGMIVRYEVDGRAYFVVPTFAHYQGSRPKEAASEYPPPPELDESSPRPTPDLVETKSSTDVDVDVDVEEEEIGADAPPSEPPAPKPKPSRKSRSTADPRTQHPAIQACKRVRGRYPNKDVYPVVIGALGDNPDIDKLRGCYQEWRVRGYNPDNMGWAVDWYVNGIVKPQPRASPAASKQADIAKRQDMIRRFAQGGGPDG